MKKFVYLYFVNQLIPDDEANTKVWGEWFEKLGENLVDEGFSFESSFQAQVSGGTATRDPDDIAGYTIVKADNLDEAVKWVQESALSKMQNLQVRVYEAR